MSDRTILSCYVGVAVGWALLFYFLLDVFGG